MSSINRNANCVKKLDTHHQEAVAHFASRGSIHLLHQHFLNGISLAFGMMFREPESAWVYGIFDFIQLLYCP
jgi:hypothetical protein